MPSIEPLMSMNAGDASIAMRSVRIWRSLCPMPAKYPVPKCERHTNAIAMPRDASIASHRLDAPLEEPRELELIDRLSRSRSHAALDTGVTRVYRDAVLGVRRRTCCRTG